MRARDLSSDRLRSRISIILLIWSMTITGLWSPGSTLVNAQSHAPVGPTGVAQVVAPIKELLISEFRFRGTAVTSTDSSPDEFIELYNNTDSDLTIPTPGDGSGGWSVAMFNPANSSINIVFTLPSGTTTIPARGHSLAVGTGYSLATYPGGSLRNATADFTYSIDIPDGAGITIFRTANPANFDATTRVDSVGFGGVTDPLFKEGAGLTPNGGISRYEDATFGESAENFSFVRKVPVTSDGTPQDTDNNESDFAFVANRPIFPLGDTNGNFRTPILGSPGPENLSAPIQRNNNITAALLDQSVPQSSPPNRVRSQTPDNDPSNQFPNLNSANGTMIIRRTFTNNTGLDVKRLRFRIVEITTLNSPGYDVNGPQADIRMLRSQDDPAVPVTSGTVTVKGVTLEISSQQSQPRGGGLNSSVRVDLTGLPGGVLATGASINIQFKYGVQKPGNFRIFVSVEAETVPPTPIISPARVRGRSPRQPARRSAAP